MNNSYQQLKQDIVKNIKPFSGLFIKNLLITILLSVVYASLLVVFLMQVSYTAETGSTTTLLTVMLTVGLALVILLALGAYYLIGFFLLNLYLKLTNTVISGSKRKVVFGLLPFQLIMLVLTNLLATGMANFVTPFVTPLGAIAVIASTTLYNFIINYLNFALAMTMANFIASRISEIKFSEQNAKIQVIMKNKKSYQSAITVLLLIMAIVASIFEVLTPLEYVADIITNYATFLIINVGVYTIVKTTIVANNEQDVNNEL